jgi:DNA replication and repair protein RecF
MYLQRISLTNFKSYEFGNFDFSKRINCIVGENGSGKTNLLDAIYFLALTKSSISTQDILCINHEAEYMMIDGIFANIDANTNKEAQITCSFQKGQKKAVLHDKKPYEKLSEHIGKFPVVLLSPNDTDIVREGSEERRKFFDGVIAQLDHEYLENLLLYNRILAQRNSLLKQFAEKNYFDADLLDIYSDPLVEYALKIHATRLIFLAKFLPIFKKHYANLSESREEVSLVYESEVMQKGFENIFGKNRQRDLAAQRTTMGIHKDDFLFEINNFTLKKFGSQGQQKSYVIALKLAQFELLASEKGFQPILLLDDIFDKLDDRRIQQLIEMMIDGTFEQVFLTDARPERTQQLLNHLNVPIQYFDVTKK